MDITSHNTARNVAIGVGGLAVAAGVVAGARFTFGIKTAVSQGGSPWGGTINWMISRRGPIKFGIKKALKGQLSEALTAMKAEAAVRKMENAVFYLGEKQVAKKVKIGYDNGPDAFRHTMGSALITERLMSKHGMNGDEATKFLLEAGNSHEGNSFLHLFDYEHYINSGLQDAHNNPVGALRAVELHEQLAKKGADEIAAMADDAMKNLPQGFRDALSTYEPKEQLLFADVLGAIAEPVPDEVLFDYAALMKLRKPVTMTPLTDAQYLATNTVRPEIGLHQRPHASSWGDIYVHGKDGEVAVRTDAPHALGFPQPFVDGKYVRGMPKVKMDLAGYRAERPENQKSAIS